MTIDQRMKLDQTRRVIHEGVDQVDPVTGLIQVLEAAVELIDIQTTISHGHRGDQLSTRGASWRA
jgi:hypothetical protein